MRPLRPPREWPGVPLAPAQRRLTSATLHVTGLAASLLGAGTLICAAVGWAYGDPDTGAVALGGLLIAVPSLVLWRYTTPPRRLGRAEAFSTITFSWVLTSLAASLPYVLAGTFPHFVNAWFEAVSGMSTTGSSVLADVEANGKGVLIYRQFTQFYGGGGIVLLAVAVLPSLGVGGLQLASSEVAGPVADRLAPRIRTTARRLWSVYAGLTGAVAVGLILAGVGPFDAIAHAMATIPTAGFSTFNTSIAHFDSAIVEAVVIAGMFAGALNFSLHYRALVGGPAMYWRSPEWRAYLYVFVAGIGAVTFLNAADGMPVLTALRDSAFSVATTLTTTGFGTADFTQWVPAAQLLLLIFMVLGGMSGSTSGGIKMIRLRLFAQIARREIWRAKHPRGAFPIRLGRQPIPETIASEVAAFVILYLIAIGIGTVVVAGLGTDLPTSLGGVVAAIGLVGPGLGDVGPASNFLAFDQPSQVILLCYMLLGRLEIYAFLLAFVAPYRWIRGSRREARGVPPASPSRGATR